MDKRTGKRPWIPASWLAHPGAPRAGGDRYGRAALAVIPMHALCTTVLLVHGLLPTFRYLNLAGCRGRGS